MVAEIEGLEFVTKEPQMSTQVLILRQILFAGYGNERREVEDTYS